MLPIGIENGSPSIWNETDWVAAFDEDLNLNSMLEACEHV
jgi:hypothetical protein